MDAVSIDTFPKSIRTPKTSWKRQVGLGLSILAVLVAMRWIVPLFASDVEKQTKGDIPSLIAVLVMLGLAGALGGVLNYLQERWKPVSAPGASEVPPPSISPVKGRRTLPLPVVQGFVAAEIVPLFLSLTDSRLFEKALAGDSLNLAVLLGLGLMTGVYSGSFLDSMRNRFEAQLKANQETVAALQKRTDVLSEKQDESNRISQDKLEEIIKDSKPGKSGRSAAAPRKPEDVVLLTFAMSDYDKRTAEGISWDLRKVGFEPADGPSVRSIVESLTKEGLLGLHEPGSQGGQARWSLTTTGKTRLRALLEEIATKASP